MALAFVFPGQGAQAVGMLAEAYEAFPEVAETFNEASEALGFDLWQMICDGPAETLALTANTQPVILTCSVALYRAWIANGGAKPSIAGGHSLGEFSALVAAGTLSLADAVRLVRRRGEAMQEAVPVGQGAMAAIIGLDDDVINNICAEITSGDDHFVAGVNFNSPGQVVIAGHTAAVEQASAALKEAGAKRALPLPVSAPFHTPLMKSVGDVLKSELAAMTLADPAFPVVSNVNAQPQTDASAIRELLIEQVSAPVQWTACVETMLADGEKTFVECGPGKVLSGLIKRVQKGVECFAIESPEALRDALPQQ